MNRSPWLLLVSAAIARAASPSAGRSRPPVSVSFPADGPKIPRGLVPIIWPKDNPYSAAKAELGWLLYFDKRLSVDGTVSCASCHDPKFAFTDGAAFSKGIRGQLGGRSAPTVINRAYSLEQFWDGRAASLEEQAKGPIANPIEMGHTHDALRRAASRGMPGYRKRFSEVFGTEKITIDHIAKAIATFERTVLSGNSPYDKFKAGDKNALTESQQRGMEIFFSNNARCDSCHEGVNFTNGKYANVGIGMDKPMPDLGRYLVTQAGRGQGRVQDADPARDRPHRARTCTTAASRRWRKSSSITTREASKRTKPPGLHQDIRPLNLKEQDKKDLVEFLKALSGEGWQEIKAAEKLPE